MKERTSLKSATGRECIQTEKYASVSIAYSECISEVAVPSDPSRDLETYCKAENNVKNIFQKRLKNSQIPTCDKDHWY